MIKKGNGTAVNLTPPTTRTGTSAPSSAARTCYSDTPTVPRAGAGVLAHLGVVPRRRPAHLGVVYGRMPIWDRWGFGTSERGGQRTSRCRGRWCTGIDPTSHYGVGYGFPSSRTPACRIDRRRLPHVQKREEPSLAVPRQKSRARRPTTRAPAARKRRRCRGQCASAARPSGARAWPPPRREPQPRAWAPVPCADVDRESFLYFSCCMLH